MYLPSEDPTKEGGVEALGRGEAALDLGYGHLVLRGRGQQGQPARCRAEYLQGKLLVGVLGGGGGGGGGGDVLLGLAELPLDGEGGNVARQEGVPGYSLQYVR